MKNFLLFLMHGYEPAGGWSDLYGDYDTQEEATTEAELRMATHFDRAQIVNLETGQVRVFEWDSASRTMQWLMIDGSSTSNFTSNKD